MTKTNWIPTSTATTYVPREKPIQESVAPFSGTISGAAPATTNIGSNTGQRVLAADGTWIPQPSFTSGGADQLETLRPSAFSTSYSGNPPTVSNSGYAYDADTNHATTFGQWAASSEARTNNRVDVFTFNTWAAKAQTWTSATINVSRSYADLSDGESASTSGSSSKTSSVLYEYSTNNGSSWTTLGTDTQSSIPTAPQTLSDSITTTPTMTNILVKVTMTRGGGGTIYEDGISLPGMTGSIDLKLFDVWIDGVYAGGAGNITCNNLTVTGDATFQNKIYDSTASSGTTGQVLKVASNGKITWATDTVGTGDVTGPASSTDNAVVRFDGTTGKIIQNSTAASIDDSGNADFLSTKSDYFDIDTTATTTAFAAGRILWNDANKTASLCFDSDSVQTDLGQSIYAYVTNADSTTINLGDAVYLFGATGNRASVKKASSSSESTSSKTLGLAAMSIAPNNTGMIITQGTLGGLNLGSYTAGDTVYLGTTAGTITNVKPSSPSNLVVIGVVERANNGNGQILVKVQNGFELSELHDVSINGTLASGNTVIYDATDMLWKNASLTAGTGISVTNGAASITIANTGVTSVTGTSPVSSSGGTTPAISLASGYGDTQNPYASKTANYFLAAPNGSAGVPTFRAIVAADIPTLNQNTTGNAATASALQTARNINGVSFNGTADITVTAAANTLTGTTLASGVTASSLTSVGTLTGLTVTRTTSGDTGTFTNTSTTNQSANVNAVSDNSTAISLRVFGSAAGSYGMLAANSTALYTTATSLNLCADNASGVIKFSTGSSVPERMRLDSSGNLGIGVTPAFKLHTYIASGTSMFKFESGANTGIYGYWTRPNQSYIQALNLDNNGDKDFSLYDATNGQVADRYYPSSTGYRAFFTNGSERMRIDSSGNIGIGVTPSAWGSAWKASQVQGYSVSTLGNAESDISLNAYNDNNGWRYIGSDYATQYRQGSGVHIWYTAPSGTAGNAISFSERMRIDNSGNVGIGTASPTVGLHVVKDQGSGYIAAFRSNVSSPYITFQTTSSITQIQGINSAFTATNDIAMQLSGGNVGIGVTPRAKLETSGSIFATSRSIPTGGAGPEIWWSGTVSGISSYDRTNSAYKPLLLEAEYSYFTTANGSEQMRINNAGVGIGTSSPASKLNVSGGNVTVSAGYGIAWSGDQARIMTPEDNVSGALIRYGSGGICRFLNGSTEHLRVDSSGNLAALGVFKGNSGTKGFGAVTTTTSTSTPTGGSSGDHYYIY